MRSVSLRLVDLERKPLIPLGFEGENEYMTINFDCKTVFDKHPAAVPTLAVTPPKGDSYPAVVVRDGDIVSWTVTDSDLVYPGEGELQLTFVDGTIIGKTYKARTKVLDSITPSGEAPTPIQNWLIQAAVALQALPTEVASSVAALMGAMVGVGETLDPDDDVTVNYDPVSNTLTIGVPHGRDGEDGHTPAITANKVGKVATFYVDGVAIVQISDGQDADPTALIDDTSTAQNRTWSAKKLDEEKQSLKTEINSKTGELKSAIDNVFDNEEVLPVTPNQSLPSNYVYISSSATAAAAWTGGDAYFVDIDDCGDVLTFGIDLTATYPGAGQAVIIFSNSASIGGSAPNYYSKANFANDHSSFAARGIDISHKNDGYITIDIPKLKTALSYVKGIAINFPTGSYLLQSGSAKDTKYVTFLRIANTVPALIVAADGSGDYTTISAAVAAAKDEDTIFIKDGTYTETVVVNKFLHLVGQSKQGTILQQNVGDYNNCTLSITQGSVCNMTIKSLAPADTSGLTDYAYAIHLDKNFASLAKYQKCEIWNCDIYSEVNDAIGAGTNYATEYDIHDCSLHVAHNPVKAGACGFKCHNGQNQTTGKVTLRNNVIVTEDANGGSIHDILFHNGGISNTQPIEILMVGNVLKYYHNGITNIFVPSAYNYGNSVPAMNTLS